MVCGLSHARLHDRQRRAGRRRGACCCAGPDEGGTSTSAYWSSREKWRSVTLLSDRGRRFEADSADAFFIASAPRQGAAAFTDTLAKQTELPNQASAWAVCSTLVVEPAGAGADALTCAEERTNICALGLCARAGAYFVAHAFVADAGLTATALGIAGAVLARAAAANLAAGAVRVRRALGTGVRWRRWWPSRCRRRRPNRCWTRAARVKALASPLVVAFMRVKVLPDLLLVFL